MIWLVYGVTLCVLAGIGVIFAIATSWGATWREAGLICLGILVLVGVIFVAVVSIHRGLKQLI